MNFQVYQSLWGMAGLPFGEDVEWSLEEKVARIAEAGFDGVEFLMEDKKHREEMLPLVDKHDLKRSNIVFPWKPEEFKDDIKASQDGGASHINLQPMPMPRQVAHCVSYLVRCMDMAAAAGYELFIETHRNRMTTDLHFTLDLLDAVPDMVLCGDLSHFLVGREFAGPPIEEAENQKMLSVVERCGVFHGRVASREQVQVSISFPHNKPWLDIYAGWWEHGFKHFKANAAPDATLTFVVELGPMWYAILGPDGKELSDRWAEAQQMMALVREIWDRC